MFRVISGDFGKVGDCGNGGDGGDGGDGGLITIRQPKGTVISVWHSLLTTPFGCFVDFASINFSIPVWKSDIVNLSSSFGEQSKSACFLVRFE